MDGLFTLLSLGAVMAGASFLAGSLPLSLSLSQSQLRLIATIGMGVLVGTSLIVIIPEGVNTLYSSTEVSAAHLRRDLYSPSHNVRGSENSASVLRRSNIPDIDGFSMPGPVIVSKAAMPPATPTKPGVVGILDNEVQIEDSEAEEGDSSHAEEHSHHQSPHAWIGVALISGFVMMFLIDKLPEHTSHTKPKIRTHHIALNNLGRRFNLTTSLDRDEEADGFLGNNQVSNTRSRSVATTTGLVIHAAADGIALGASSSSSNTGLSFIIFFAIMVHKAPAAFGLTSVLLKQGLSKRSARAHLLMFSLAAPVGSLLTWIFAHAVGAVRVRSAENTTWWTGMLLLFSGGTFLYVAMHSMQDSSMNSHEPHMNGHTNGLLDGRESSQPEQKPSLRDLLAACFGMILPLFLQIGHAH